MELTIAAISFVTWLSIAAIALVRIEMVFRFRIKAIERIFDSYRPDEIRGLLRKQINERSRAVMILDLRKWTYRQFYGDL